MKEKYNMYDEFRAYESILKSDEYIIRIKDLTDRYKKLSFDDRKKLLNIFANALEEIEIENRNKLEECKMNGHNFSEWEKSTAYRPINPEEFLLIDIKYSIWKRECGRCGYKEFSKNIPKELKLKIKD